MVISTAAFGQPTPEWTSPVYNSLGGGWLALRADPLEARFFVEDLADTYYGWSVQLNYRCDNPKIL